MAIIHPTTTSNIGFGFGSIPSASFYEDRTWHGTFMVNFHGGIDYWGPRHYPIWAAANGIVRYAGFGVPYIGAAGGNGVVIQHGPSMKTIYGHMQTVSVVPGQAVVSGQSIGTMGDSGIANGVIHLHFEVRTITPEWGEDVENPAVLMAGGAQANTYLANQTQDIPWIEPLEGTVITLGLCQPQADGTFTLPSGATSVVAVYFDRIRASVAHYTVIRGDSGTLYIRPVTTLIEGTEVRADYVT
jgi:murein DD-endopeptidase MepM/ murein hydrolase activator NlpD